MFKVNVLTSKWTLTADTLTSPTPPLIASSSPTGLCIVHHPSCILIGSEHWLATIMYHSLYINILFLSMMMTILQASPGPTKGGGTGRSHKTPKSMLLCRLLIWAVYSCHFHQLESTQNWLLAPIRPFLFLSLLLLLPYSSSLDMMMLPLIL